MAKRVDNPYEKIIAREELHYSKVFSQETTKLLRSPAVQSKVDRIFKTGDSASQIDWKTKDISKATKLYRQEVDKKLKSLCRTNPSLMTFATVEMGMEKGRFLPKVKVTVTYAKQMKGGKIHFVVPKDTLRSVSKKYYDDDVYWEVVAKANPKSWVDGASLEIPLMLVPDDLSKSKASCASGGTHTPAAVLFPEVSVDFSKTLLENEVLVPCKGLPFHILLKFKCSGTLTAGKIGTIPASFKLNDYSATATKAVKGLKFSAKVKSPKATDLAVVSISGGAANWSFSIALEDGHKLTVTAAPKPVKLVQSGFSIVGKVGFSVTAEVVPEVSGLRVGTTEMAKEIMAGAIAAGVTFVMFAALRGMNMQTATSVLLNKPGNGTITYEEAQGVI
ncbi:MAG: hypothetical protein AAF393_12950 [Pseudomonadota bacterium]